MAREHFGLAADANSADADPPGCTTTFETADGRAVLRQGATASYDLIVVDLSVGGFIDAAACTDLRRMLRPGGACVHNYNFAGAADQAKLGALTSSFAEVHRLVISGANTILVSCTEPTAPPPDTASSFPAMVERAARYPYASPLLFDLRADLGEVGGFHSEALVPVSQSRIAKPIDRQSLTLGP